MRHQLCSCFFFFNDTATTEIYTLSLHDALPISLLQLRRGALAAGSDAKAQLALLEGSSSTRSEEHTSELQSQSNLVCRLLLEKKKAQLERCALRAVVLIPW